MVVRTKTRWVEVLVDGLPLVRSDPVRLVEDPEVRHLLVVGAPPATSIHVETAQVETVQIFDRAPVGDVKQFVALIGVLRDQLISPSEDCEGQYSSKYLAHLPDD